MRKHCLGVSVVLILSTLKPADVLSEEFEIPAVAQVGQGAIVSGELIYSLDNKPTPQCHGFNAG